MTVQAETRPFNNGKVVHFRGKEYRTELSEPPWLVPAQKVNSKLYGDPKKPAPLVEKAEIFM